MTIYTSATSAARAEALLTTFDDLTSRRKAVAVVGLGYVGLPLAVAFSRNLDVIGFDISQSRIDALRAGHDRTNEVDDTALRSARIDYTAHPEDLAKAGVIIVAVPTPIDGHRNPDITPVTGASRTVGRHMSKGCVVVYESTVYPGLTEEICVPILEQESGLRHGIDFSVGYSPERINPGDKVHTLETIIKIVAGANAPTTTLLADLYGSVVVAGIHRASSIRVAEAAKVIENTQRDLNIALMNELAIIFDKMGIDTLEVLEAAGTKWNFLPFRPGLVGGHCIGVDPYYLTFKAEEIGYHPEVILAGRRINDNMGKYIAECTVKRLIKRGKRVNGARVGILGFTFKENVPDLRNTRVIDVVHELRDYDLEVLVHDPQADPAEARHEYGQELVHLDKLVNLDVLLLAVGHASYTMLNPQDLLARFATPEQATLLDIKGFFNPQALQAAGIDYWRL
ncbi:MAG: nucleotide sugar dehydrogenase [Desulfovibrionaceae bacterium]